MKAFCHAVCFGLLCSLSFAGEPFSVLRSESLGAARMGLSAPEVAKAFPGKWKRGAEQRWEADAAWHQKWTLPGQGLVLDMVSEEKGGTKEVASITVTAPSPLATKKGIRIGSSERDVQMAYQEIWNKEESREFDCFVAGSVYGGLLFHFQNGKVSEIFLGAAAE